MTRNFQTATRLFLYIALIIFTSQHAALAQDKAAKIQEVLALAHKYGQFNGSALVAENGKVIYKGAFGMANMEWGILNTPDTRFRLGSITKQFTSMLILQLVEQGKIKLDGKLSDYLLDYRKDTGDKVTIHHLLTHTSGIPSYTGLPNFFADVSRNPYKVADFVKKYASGDLEFEPGAKFSYNNSGYFLLGAIIERVTGKPYEQVLKENIFDPAGMKYTGYDHHDMIIPKRASGYARTADGYTNAVYLENYAYGWAIANTSFKQNDQPVQMIRHGGGINGFTTTIIRFPKEKNLIVMLDNTGQNVDRPAETITSILYNQPYDLPKMSIVPVIEKAIADKGIEAGIATYRELKAKQSATYDFSEPELNQLGYRLMATGKLKEAIEIFKLNVEANPQGFNAYDSLA